MGGLGSPFPGCPLFFPYHSRTSHYPTRQPGVSVPSKSRYSSRCQYSKPLSSWNSGSRNRLKAQIPTIQAHLDIQSKDRTYSSASTIPLRQDLAHPLFLSFRPSVKTVVSPLATALNDAGCLRTNFNSLPHSDVPLKGNAGRRDTAMLFRAAGPSPSPSEHTLSLYKGLQLTERSATRSTDHP
ncbi:hypothetical protein B0O80DRAFT_429738 [Mortierella sp. GBAus27b]|nr:hypothetical protein B0O80DRAFT_429738 [Mortierella sp. GBAus27b]